jgi:hypothetical protein
VGEGVVSGLKQIHPEPSPLVGKFVGSDQRIDQLVALIRILAGHEFPHRARRWQQTSRIQVDPADKFLIAGQRSVRNPIAFHAPEYLFINVILTWHIAR